MKTINFQIYERNGGHTHFSLADTECRMINCRLRIEIYWNGMAHDRTTKSAFINFWWAKANQNTAAAPNNSNNSQHHFGQILWLNTVFSWGSAGTIIWIIMKWLVEFFENAWKVVSEKTMYTLITTRFHSFETMSALRRGWQPRIHPAWIQNKYNHILNGLAHTHTLCENAF